MTEAQLADNVGESCLNSYAIKSCYATAFCRFVTGLLDSEQNSRHKISMYDKAKELELPSSFVELRHQITHGELPSLLVLRQATIKSLEWLWNHYWSRLEDSSNTNDVQPLSKSGKETLKRELMDILQNYLHARQLLQRANSDKETGISSDTIRDPSIQLVRLCKDNKGALLEVVDNLLKNETFIPGNKLLGDHPDEAFNIWDPLLKSLAIRQRLFLTVLVDKMLYFLTLPSKSDMNIETFREAMFMWLEHIYAKKTWSNVTKRDRTDGNAMVVLCLQNHHRLTARLAMSIIQHPGRARLAKLYGERVTKAAEGWESAKGDMSGGRDRVKDEMDLGMGGWQKCQRWVGAPVGQQAWRVET
ncbi:MAG: hypothetical protein LQ342_002944 [Letrouitia transgressa]|nr:MAG: hypothetical protein LQ342_002944 [Letrouitia transgressa]